MEPFCTKIIDGIVLHKLLNWWNECSQLNDELQIYNACHKYTTLKKKKKEFKQTKNEIHVYIKRFCF